MPDFKKRGEEGDVLCELKFINACKSRYPRNPRRRDGARAVERRAEGLTEEYCKSAREVDWKYCGVPRPPRPQPGVPLLPRQIGPVENRLNGYGRVKGWVFGAWGECSDEVHTMVQRQKFSEQPPCQAEASSSSLVKHSWLEKLHLFGDAYLSLLCSSRQDFSLTAFNCLVRVQARQQGGESGLSRQAEQKQGRGGLSWCVCSRAAVFEGVALVM